MRLLQTDLARKRKLTRGSWVGEASSQQFLFNIKTTAGNSTQLAHKSRRKAQCKTHILRWRFDQKLLRNHDSVIQVLIWAWQGECGEIWVLATPGLLGPPANWGIPVGRLVASIVSCVWQFWSIYTGRRGAGLSQDWRLNAAIWTPHIRHFDFVEYWIRWI